MNMENLLLQGGWLDRFTRRVAYIGLIGLLLVAIATMVDVLLRWLFNSPIEGYEDVTRLLFSIIIASCFPALLLQQRNITIRFLGKALGPRATLWLEALGSLATLFFFTAMAWQIGSFAWEEVANHHYTQTLELATGPWWWATTAVLILCVPVQGLMALAAVARAITGRVADLPEGSMI